MRRFSELSERLAKSKRELMARWTPKWAVPPEGDEHRDARAAATRAAFEAGMKSRAQSAWGGVKELAKSKGGLSFKGDREVNVWLTMLIGVAEKAKSADFGVAVSAARMDYGDWAGDKPFPEIGLGRPRRKTWGEKAPLSSREEIARLRVRLLGAAQFKPRARGEQVEEAINALWAKSDSPDKALATSWWVREFASAFDASGSQKRDSARAFRAFAWLAREFAQRKDAEGFGRAAALAWHCDYRGQSVEGMSAFVARKEVFENDRAKWLTALRDWGMDAKEKKDFLRGSRLSEQDAVALLPSAPSSGGDVRADRERAEAWVWEMAKSAWGPQTAAEAWGAPESAVNEKLAALLSAIQLEGAVRGAEAAPAASRGRLRL